MHVFVVVIYSALQEKFQLASLIFIGLFSVVTEPWLLLQTFYSSMLGHSIIKCIVNTVAKFHLNSNEARTFL